MRNQWIEWSTNILISSSFRFLLVWHIAMQNRSTIRNTSLRWMDTIIKILERNDYKLHITPNQKYNQFLKGVGLALGCGFSLTTHVARHTFACTISLGEGIPKEVLQVMMGHSSIRKAELYAKLSMEFTTRNLDKKLFHVWG